MNPVGLPMNGRSRARYCRHLRDHQLFDQRLFLAQTLCLFRERALVLAWHHLDHVTPHNGKVREQAFGVNASRVRHVLHDGDAQEVDVLGVGKRLQVHHLPVATALELPIEVEHIRYAAAHAGSEVTAGAAEHYHASAGHVLAPVITSALDHHDRAAVTNAEALTCDAANVAF